MDAMELPLLSVAQPTDDVHAAETDLDYAVFAIDMYPSTANPCIRDIQTAIHRQFGTEARPISISSFHPDFVIKFASPSERDRVLRAEFLRARKFSMIFIPWSRTYRSRAISWRTEITIDISDLPPQACHVRYLEPLLLTHCSIRTCTFNERAGKCRVTGFALSVSSVPASGHVAVQYQEPDGVLNQLFPVTMRVYLRSEAPRFRSDSSPKNSAESPAAYDTDDSIERELLEEAYAEHHRASPSGTTGFDDDGWESDRSWHLRYRK